MQEDVLAHLAESCCAFLKGEREEWGKLTHKQRVERIRKDVRRIRRKRFHKQWQGERTLDRMLFAVKQAGGIASVESLAVRLGLGQAAIRKAVRERSRGRLALDGKGHVVNPIFLPNLMDVTMHTLHHSAIEDDLKVTNRGGERKS
jgi:hypothetical protein